MKKSETNTIFYRYEAVTYAVIGIDGELESSVIPNPRIELRIFNLHKETSKGYWIGHGLHCPDNLRANSRWVSKTAKKRYAYPTKEEAMNNYIKRTESRIKILNKQLLLCEIALRKAKKIKL